MTLRARTTRLAGSALLTALIWSGSAFAEKAGATQLFEEGRELVEAGKHVEACVKFEESLALKRGVGTMFNLADCYERVGRTASAYRLFMDVVDTTVALAQPARAELARSRADALVPKLPRLLVELKEPVDGITVYRDDEPLGEAMLGQAMPVDPGVHVVRVTAPGKQAWSIQTDLQEGPTVMTLTVPPLQDEQAAPATVAAPDPEPEVKPEPEAETHSSLPSPIAAASAGVEDDSGSGSGRAALTYALVGVGVVGVTGSVVMALDFEANNDDAKSVCPSSQNCSNAEIQAHNDLVDAAERSRNWSVVSGAVGGAALIGAGILWLTADDSPEQARVLPGPLVTANGGFGASVSGTF